MLRRLIKWWDNGKKAWDYTSVNSRKPPVYDSRAFRILSMTSASTVRLFPDLESLFA